MKYYLINNTIKKGSDMPEKELYFDGITSFEIYKQDYNNWLSSLQPCEISERELTRIRIELGDFKEYEILDVTDIVEDKCTGCDSDKSFEEKLNVHGKPFLSCCPDANYKLVFKHPKQVDEYGYIKCGDCNKFYLCTNCGAQCGSEGHFIEPKQVDGEIEAVECKHIYEHLDINFITGKVICNNCHIVVDKN